MSTANEGTLESSPLDLRNVNASSPDEEEQHQHQHQHQQETKDGEKTRNEIEKAVRFWTHPMTHSIPSKEKIQYLKTKGFSDADIHTIWETIVDQELLSKQNDNPSPHPHPNPHRDTFENQHYTSQIYPKMNSLGQPVTTYRPDARTSSPNNPLGIPFEEAEDETPRTMALLTIGGILGLTAAAAVRWLNGGDFTLFPPPTIEQDLSDPKELTLQSNNMLHERSLDSYCNIDYNDTGEEELQGPLELQPSHYSDMDQHVATVLQQIHELTDLVRTQNKVHQQLLDRMNAQQTTVMTDQSMAFLKRTQHLTEIKAVLEQIPSGNHLIEKALDIVHQYMKDEADSLQYPLPSIPNTSDPDPESQVTVLLSTEATLEQIPSPTTALRDAIQQLAHETNSVADLQGVCQVLYLYVTHLSTHPHVPRYRKIFTSNNASFQKLLALKSAVNVLLAVGFVSFEGYMEWKPENESEALASLQHASLALSIMKSTNSNASDPSSELDGTNVDVATLCGRALAAIPSTALSAGYDDKRDIGMTETTMITTTEGILTMDQKNSSPSLSHPTITMNAIDKMESPASVSSGP